MNEGLLRVALFLAYGPFVLMVLVYLAALGLRLTGRPEPLALLIRRTGPQEPVKRDNGPAH